MQKDFEVVVPVLNEVSNVTALVERIDNVCQQAGCSYGIIFIDDNSTDGTFEKIMELAQSYPIKFARKQGNKGKAYSIIEGARLVESDIVVMIDADLQYPPESIPEMVGLMADHGVVVANRKKHETSFLRKLASKVNGKVFGKLLLNFGVDTQSGLKAFRREIIDHISEDEVTGWTIDMHLLQTGVELGYTIGCVDIDFLEREYGESKIKLGRASAEIALAAIKLKLRKGKIYRIESKHSSKLLGSGVVHKKNRFITHTDLPHEISALKTTDFKQKIGIFTLLAILSVSLYLSVQNTALVMIAFLSVIYFVDVLFSLYVLLKSLHFPPELTFSDEQLRNINDASLPVYTILCPLYKESNILAHFVDSINKLDWPKDKLDVMLLLEEDDEDTIRTARDMNLPSHFRIVVVPDSQPKTKPKACNYGLALARGEYSVIYDAEDVPDPLQLKKAYLGFLQLGEKAFCMQSKLNYFNANHNLLTRLFTAEYSLWFDVILPGLQSIEATIPLGGTSNHFRTQQLKNLHAWDPFNVTEDCDLGVRLFNEGYKTAIIDSTTLEEANSNVRNWLRQRSRWIKGYFQTYLVHMRKPVSFFRKHGIQALIFQLVIGMRMTFILINPILWLATISYFTLYKYVGSAIDALYPAPIFYIAVFSLVFGNFMYLYNYMIGCAKREHWNLVKFVFLVPFYWLLTSVAAIIAAYQLIVKPHYWEKTKHGLHLSKTDDENLQMVPLPKVKNETSDLGNWRGFLSQGAFLVIASVIVNIMNFVYSMILSRAVNSAMFGYLSVMGSVFFIFTIMSIALNRTIAHRSAHLLGKYGVFARKLWVKFRRRSVLLSFGLLALWVLSADITSNFLGLDSSLPIIMFSPIILVALPLAVDIGYLMGSMRFASVGLLLIVEAAIKLISTIIFLNLGLTNWLYASVSLGVLGAFLLGWFISGKTKQAVEIEGMDAYDFPYAFYITATLIGLSSISFKGIDVLYAEHYLSAVEAGKYALISTAGKMIFFGGTLLVQFINPLISRLEGEGKETKQVFYRILGLTTLSSLLFYIMIGIFGEITMPIVYGRAAHDVAELLPLFGLGVFAFTIGMSVITYYQAKKVYVFSIIGFLMAIVQIYGLQKYSVNLIEFTNFMGYFGLLYLSVIMSLHYLYEPAKVVAWNFRYFIGLFLNLPDNSEGKSLRILIFNWYDIKHVYAGGAEIYIQEIAERLVKSGYQVTMFAGNDGHSERYEELNGVQIIRRGGLFTVPIWAAIYYLLKLRNKYDLVIDIPKGVPFFTPLYSRKPKICLVHHVHTDMFMSGLRFPLKQMAVFFEKTLMPFIYRDTRFITISESSRKAMRDIGIDGEISIIPPGFEKINVEGIQKTPTPTILSLGRLRRYKSIDTAIHAVNFIKEYIPEIKLVIAGTGEDEERLKYIVEQLGLGNNVEFRGKVSEEEKAILYKQSWVSVQPSTVEGWGITVIESNSHGTPVVASNVAGLRDSVINQKTGVLTEVNSPQMFAMEIMRIITDEQYRNSLSGEALKWSENFTWETAAEKFRQVIISRLVETQTPLNADTFAWAVNRGEQ